MSLNAACVCVCVGVVSRQSAAATSTPPLASASCPPRILPTRAESYLDGAGVEHAGQITSAMTNSDEDKHGAAGASHWLRVASRELPTPLGLGVDAVTLRSEAGTQIAPWASELRRAKAASHKCKCSVYARLGFLGGR